MDADPPELDIDPSQHLAVLPYSSGTTGVPKGVMLTHRNLVANVAQAHDTMALRPEDRVIAVLPFFHIYGLTVLMNMALGSGATLVTMPRFDLTDFLRTLQDHKITVAFVAPPIVLALAKHPMVDEYDLSSLRFMLSGAAPLDADLAVACAKRLGCAVVQGYGMTELSPVSHATNPEDESVPPGSVGRAVANTECRVLDVATGADLGVGETGEILVRGPQVMKGYLGHPEATDATVDADGWLHTGDLGHVDGGGNWYIVDRVKELIKYKGYQVPPAELEAVLLGHPEIADAAVVGANSADGEEYPARLHRGGPRRDADWRRGSGVRGGAGLPVQEGPWGSVRRRYPEERLRQDPPPRTPRPGSHHGLVINCRSRPQWEGRCRASPVPRR